MFMLLCRYAKHNDITSILWKVNFRHFRLQDGSNFYLSQPLIIVIISHKKGKNNFPIWFNQVVFQSWDLENV